MILISNENVHTKGLEIESFSYTLSECCMVIKACAKLNVEVNLFHAYTSKIAFSILKNFEFIFTNQLKSNLDQ